MRDKTWIKVKSGLLQPKHIAAIGNSIWLFLYAIDVADWDTGIVYGWKDEDVAERLGISKSTVRKYRNNLQDNGYISCKQGQYSQEITIKNWSNPRKYTGEVINQDDTNETPSQVENSQGNTQGDTQGDTQAILDRSTPTSYPHITEHIPQVAWGKITELYNLPPDVFETHLNRIQQEGMERLLEKDAEKCVKIAVYYSNRGETFIRMIGGILNNFDTWRERKQDQKRKVDIV